MLIFDRYLFKQVLLSTTVGVVFMSFLALSGQVLKETKNLFSPDMEGFGLLFGFLFNTFPYMLNYMLPWAFLTAVLLTTKALSSNNEIISIRMAGLTYLRIGLPVFILGLGASALLYHSTASMTPKARIKISDMLSASNTEARGIQLTPALFNNLIGKDFRVNMESIQGNEIRDLHLYRMDHDAGTPKSYTFAKKAILDFDTPYQVSIALEHVYLESYNGDLPPETLFAENVAPLILPTQKKAPSQKAKYQTNAEIVSYLSSGDSDHKKRMKYFSEISSRISMSLSCLSFAFLGFPLGLQHNRKMSNNGFLWAIITAALFFGLLVGLEKTGDTFLIRGLAIISPNLIAWLFAAILFRKVRFSS